MPAYNSGLEIDETLKLKRVDGIRKVKVEHQNKWKCSQQMRDIVVDIERRVT